MSVLLRLLWVIVASFPIQTHKVPSVFPFSFLRPLERILRLTADFAKSRAMFGAKLWDQQTVQYRLAQLSAQLDALRALLYQTTKEMIGGAAEAEEGQRKQQVMVATSKAKLLAGQLAKQIPDSCLQVIHLLGLV